MIAKLVRAGKKVGVTAVSHKVIGNLLEKVVEFAGEDARCGHKVGRRSEGDPEELDVVEFTDNKKPRAALDEGEGILRLAPTWVPHIRP